MDHLKPPSRLNVVLLSLPPRTQAVLDYFFSSTGRSSFAVTDSEQAHAAIFDVDTLASRQHWDAYHAGTGRPGIAMSIQPQELPGTVWVRKPITPAALLHAAAELSAQRWHPMQAPVAAVPVAAVPVAAPAAPVAPVMTPVAEVLAPAPVPVAPAPVVQPVAEVTRAVVVEPQVVAQVAAPAVEPQPAAAPAPVEVVAVATPAPVPTPVVEPEAAPVVQAAPVPAPVPSLVAAQPAVVDEPPAPASAPAPAALPRGEFRAQPAPPEPRPAGLGGFLKRLFGAAPAPVAQPAQAAARPAVARTTYPASAPATRPAPVSPLGKAAMASAAPVAAGPVESAAAAAPVPAPAPAVVAPEPVVLGVAPVAPVRPVVVPLNKTHVRKRGRKGPTRWVDPNGTGVHGPRDGGAPSAQDAGNGHDDEHEGDEGDDFDGHEAQDVAETPSETTARAATPAANDAGASAGQAADVITLEAEPVVRIEPYGSESAAPAANAEGAASAASDGEAEARPAVVWRGLSSPADQADEALYCGSRADATIEQLQADRTLRHDPAHTLVAALTEAYLIGRKWQVPTQFECSAGRVIVDSPRNRVLLSFDDAQLPEILARGPDKRIKTLALNRHEQAALQLREGEAWQPLDRLLWRAGLLQSQGRLPVGVDLKRPVYLKHWPNLTRVQRTPHAMRVAALWATRGAGLVETAELLKIPQRHVFAFYSAAAAADLVTEDGSAVKRAQRRGARNRGLLTRLLGWLQA